jgi:hypothetical protein
VIGAIVYGRLHIIHGVSGEHTMEHGVLNALVDSRDVLTRNPATDDLIDEFVPLARIRLKSDPAVAELAASSRLLLVAALCLRGLADSLVVRDSEVL